MTSAAAGQQSKDLAPAERMTAPESKTAGRPWLATLWYWAPVVVPAAVMALLGFWRLARDSAMGNDEVATRYAAMLSLGQLWRLLSHVDAVHGFYYLLIHAWIAVGSSPEVLRLPSVAAMIAAVAMTAILGRRLTGSGLVALFAGLIVAFMPAISYYAQTARSYALVYACVVGSTLALLRALEAQASPSPNRGQIARAWLLYGGLTVVGGYLNEMALLVLAAHAVTIVHARYGRAILLRWVVTAASSAVLVAPLAILSSGQGAAVAWIAPPNRASLRLLLHDYLGATLAANLLLFAFVAVALLAPAPARPAPAEAADSAEVGDPAGAAGAAGAEPADVRSAPAPRAPWWHPGPITLQSVAAPLLVVPAFLLIAESFVARPFFVDRYVLYGEAGAALLAAAGLVRIGQWLREARWSRLARRSQVARLSQLARRGLPVWLPGAIGCLCVLLVQVHPQLNVRTPGSRLYDFGGPARYVAANARSGDGVLFFDAFYRKDRLGYPEDFTKTTDFAMAVSPQQAGTFQGTDKPLDLVRPLMLQRQRIWVIGLPPSASLSTALLRGESLILSRDFTKIADRHFRNISVTLWRRR